MSEPRTIYIPCAAGANTFADCQIRRCGDLFQLIGHPIMDFTPDGARLLAYWILEDLGDIPIRRPACSESGDAIVDEVMAMLRARSKLGQEKYGTTLMRDDLNLIDWMYHAVEESLDRTLYMIRAIKDLEKLYNDGK